MTVAGAKAYIVFLARYGTGPRSTMIDIYRKQSSKMTSPDPKTPLAEKQPKEIVIASGETVQLRALKPADEDALGNYFLGLSDASKRVYGPHPFDRPTATAVCRGAGQDGSLRLLALSGTRIIGYFILILGVRDGDRQRYAGFNMALDDATDCTLAPSVADAYQNGGLGSHMMEHLKVMARDLGRKRMLLWGGVRQDNPRARHFYTKFGFVQVGEFFASSVNNFDMIAPL
jgi:diamine N-acetyltransferase